MGARPCVRSHDLPWTDTATFSLRVLLDAEAIFGFLTGIAFNGADYAELEGKTRLRYAVSTSYHAAYVMGFLCATLVRKGYTPSANARRTHRWAGAAAELLRHIDSNAETSSWRPVFDNLPTWQRDALAPMLLTIFLQRARTRCDFQSIQMALETALAVDCVEGPAPGRQPRFFADSLCFRCNSAMAAIPAGRDLDPPRARP